MYLEMIVEVFCVLLGCAFSSSSSSLNLFIPSSLKEGDEFFESLSEGEGIIFLDFSFQASSQLLDISS